MEYRPDRPDQRYGVIMHGTGADSDGWDRYPTLEEAIKDAWRRLGPHDGGLYPDRGFPHGWHSATVRDLRDGLTARLRIEDRILADAARRGRMDAAIAEMDARKAVMDPADLITIGGDDDEQG